MAKTIFIAAGGTGGHVFPALEVARQLKSAGYIVHWVGTKGGLETRLVPPTGIPLSVLSTLGLRGKPTVQLLKGWLALLHSMWQVVQLFKQIQPDLVLGMGGYVSGPVGLVARLKKIPMVLHEQNAYAGTTNRLLAPWARQVFCAFDGAFPKSIHACCIGNPVRPEIASIGRRGQSVIHQPINVLVLGGSLGARAINLAVPEAVARLPVTDQPMIKHQCGAGKCEETESAYAEHGCCAEVVPFIDDMPEALSWSDLVICRAGAMTVSECAVAGRPAIFIPYPHATDQHQHANARAMVEAGAARCLDESQLGTLTDMLKTLVTDPRRLVSMSDQALRCARLDAAERIVRAIDRLSSRADA